MASNYKKFNGKRFSLYDTSNTKAQADKQAAQLRKTCKYVRVVKVGGITVGYKHAYATYTRQC